MFDYAELPSHPDFPDSKPGSVSDSSSDPDSAPLKCGLCAKGPEAKREWKDSGRYCFNSKDPCEDPSTVESKGFYCFTDGRLSIYLSICSS